VRTLQWTDARLRFAAAAGVLILGCASVNAATLCVDPSGKGGCKTTIAAAVAAANPNDVIRVDKGTYHEDVVIQKSLSLLGENPENTIVDAAGKLNGINVDGYNNGAPLNLAHVIVSGFTVRNANAQGIVVTNSSDVTISNNRVFNNDKALAFPLCPAPGFPPYFQAGEAFDCGEGIHLSGVDHSIVSDNLVQHNAGGILISDDTGPNHDNVISGNIVEDNPLDCGITIASHHFNFGPTDPSLGIYRITVVGNTARRNGLISGEGAGVGIFAGPPGAQNNANVITNNVLTDNALPGVAMHAHAPFQSLSNHLIIGNQISGNGPDGDPPTSDPTGISISAKDETGNGLPVLVTGVVIDQNVFKHEGIDIGISMENPASAVTAHFNSFSGAVGIDNIDMGTISATANWWKCSKGPGANGCSTVMGNGITTNPWLTQPVAQGDDGDGHQH
jgi:parallel beta-helix repeat protein